jgi:murein DD-endopeptidase MepM/ murein hydrolase activator NlpD
MAEVKVKITAQNEVRTGLQQALQETQKFSQQAKAAVSNTMTINPFAGDDRLGPLRDLQRQARELRDLARAPIEPAPQAASAPELAKTSSAGASAIRGLAADLANATSAGDVFEAVVRRITTAFGGLVAAAGGFAIGSLIRRTLEDAAAGLEGLIDQSQALQNSFTNLLSPTTTFDQLASAIQGASQQIEGLIKANEKLQSGIGFQIADYINAFDLSSAANREVEQGAGNARLALATAIAAATQRENRLAEARTDEERKLIALQAEREQLLAAASKVSPEAASNLQQLFAAQDRRIAAEQRERTGTREGNASRQLGPGTIEGIREFERAQEAARRALGDEFGPGTTDAAAGGFRVDAAEFARQQGERLAAEEAAFRGSAGASALQRIGFASNEFFDTRQKRDPSEETRRAAEFAKQILDILKKGEPLVLPSTN